MTRALALSAHRTRLRLFSVTRGAQVSASRIPEDQNMRGNTATQDAITNDPLFVEERRIKSDYTI
jgi:hypothetical protein